MLALLAAAPARADDKLRVGTPEPTAFVFSTVDVGIGIGIFKKHGLDVERFDFAGGAKLNQAMATGALDISVATGSDILFVIRGAPDRAVAAFGNDLNSVSILARTDDTVKTLDDVKGKTVGTTTAGSFTSWVARRIAINHGWGPDGIKLAYLGQMSGIYAGLFAKNVDAIVGTTASALVMQKEGRVRILVKAGSEITNFISNVIYASQPMMTEHPDELRRFLAAWFETIQYMRGHKDETIRLTQPATNLPPDIASKVYDLEMPAMSTTGRFDEKALAATMQSFLDVGVLDKLPDNPKALYTEEFLP